MRTVIGIDIGGTNFRIGAVEKDGTVHNFSVKSSVGIFDGNTVEALFKEIKEFMNLDDSLDYIAVAIGVPSMVSRDKRTIYSTPNLQGFDNIEISSPLSELLKIPVYLDRDVNFLLLNDIEQAKLGKNTMIAGFYIGTGFGNSIFFDGHFLRGKNGVAGELGHIPLYGIEEQCTCGNYACAETRCSGRYLEYLCEKNFPDVKIREVFTKCGENHLIKNYVKNLAIPIATEINILDPDYVIISGGVVAMPDFPLDLLNESIHFYSRKPYPEKNLSIIVFDHTRQSGVIGAAKYVFNYYGGNL